MVLNLISKTCESITFSYVDYDLLNFRQAMLRLTDLGVLFCSYSVTWDSLGFWAAGSSVLWYSTTLLSAASLANTSLRYSENYFA